MTKPQLPSSYIVRECQCKLDKKGYPSTGKPTFDHVGHVVHSTCMKHYKGWTFICASCDELSAWWRGQKPEPKRFPFIYCENCQEAFNLPPYEIG